MGLLRKGLHPKERRAVATHAVSKIGKLGLKQHGMSLSITDKVFVSDGFAPFLVRCKSVPS